MSQPLLGTVVAVQANYYFVRLTSGEQLLCVKRALLRKLGQRVMVGDQVEVEEPDWQGMRGAICGVLPRRTLLDRPPVANASQVLLVFAMNQPLLDEIQLSRFLVTAESTGIEVLLCLSKADLIDPEEQAQLARRLTAWGYPPLLISAQAGWGREALLERLADGITVVSGPSGVGKSSLINWLIPDLQIRVSAVSGKLERGRHTTRHVELFELPQGGLLADTPGFNQPDLLGRPEEIGDYFPEVRSRVGHCQFSDCLHREEPGCGVRGDWDRYDFYQLVLGEAIERAAIEAKQANRKTNLKQKNRGQGQVTYEPILATKYRKKGRNTEQQPMKLLRGKPEELPEEPD
jgi:ribosome biogenesis GTPase / thiamine phosphate phosphatase